MECIRSPFYLALGISSMMEERPEQPKRKESATTTSVMTGRRAWFSCKHMAANPTACFSSDGGGPCMAITSSWNLVGSPAHPTRLCSPSGRLASMARRPVMSSSSSTPKTWR